MQKTLMQGLNEKDMQAVLNSYDLKPYYYPTLFPLKETNLLTWKMLEGIAGLKIAADLVARGATIPRKTREALAKIAGDIPKIAISREMLEDELTEYDLAVVMAGNNADLKSLVEFWANDTQYCWTGIAAKAEYIALRQISLGKVAFTSANNAAIVTEYNVDYGLLAAQKIGVDTSWSTGVSAKPITKDFPAALAAGKTLCGATYKFGFLTTATLAKLVAQDEVKKACASFADNALSNLWEPDLAAVNAMLMRKVKLKGLQLIEIDQDITLEGADGSRTTINPFEEDVVLFSESKVLGNTYWKRPIDLTKDTVSTMAMNGHTLVKKYSEGEPLKEVTIGISNLFPAWNLSTRSVLMQTNATSWSK